MRVTTSGELRRLDVSPFIDLLPPLREERAGLGFDLALTWTCNIIPDCWASASAEMRSGTSTLMWS